MQSASDGERQMPDARRQVHRPTNAGGSCAVQKGELQARALFSRVDSSTSGNTTIPP